MIRIKDETSCCMCGCDIFKGDSYKTVECLKSYGDKDKRCWLRFCLKCYGYGGKDLVDRLAKAKE